ncbi:hypothetical protein [Acinetobacter ursingii]|uniref:DUF4935 domain-containing protein n=4 Tax=Acinetobacter ursingii TaxID=108980 RepID=A0A3D2SKD0_9GAMM|nr:hypothetical protein [Acinetobacter ursingii]MCH2003981.1 hypothetical protein [Acinetobacter ursingii]MCU4380709.1 hypothetical protein [Acinetobacter ursingii]MCU4608269.1 hypothetical protein [Acinetobacter ursingii]HCK29035.1 hypothetical protein [Acinetobacter ursingii]
MIHIAFDTSGIGKNRNINDVSYKTLQNLYLNKLITIHIPYIVQRELETQEVKFYKDRYNEFNKAFKKYYSLPQDANLKKLFSEFNKSLQQNEEIISDKEAEFFSKKWLVGLGAKIYNIEADEAKEAFEAYFQGIPPLKSIKHRDDIPDSFICRSFEKIKNSVDHIYLVVNDQKIHNTFKDKHGFTLVKNINELLAQQELQSVISKQENVDEFILEFFSFINKEVNEKIQPSELEFFISRNIGDEIVYKNIYGVKNSNEYNGEATINSYGNTQKIEVNFAKPIYYGDEKIGFEFELEIDVNIEYFINKTDYFMMFDEPSSKLKSVSISNWNDHTFEAEDNVFVKVVGIVSMQIMDPCLNNDSIENKTPIELQIFLNELYSQAEFKIESIEDIELLEDKINNV